MYLFVPCDKKSHGTEISFPIRSNRLSHPHPRILQDTFQKQALAYISGSSTAPSVLVSSCPSLRLAMGL